MRGVLGVLVVVAVSLAPLRALAGDPPDPPSTVLPTVPSMSTAASPSTDAASAAPAPSSAAPSADPEADFRRANDALAKNDFAAAEAGYRAILAAGVHDPDVYYNLGNVLYREEKLAGAILAWRHAARLAPRDPDAQANLDYARRQIRDHLDVVPTVPWFAPWQIALTGDEGAWAGGLALGLALGALALRRRFPQLPLVGVGVALGALGGVAGIGGLAQLGVPPSAVVLVGTVTATSDLGGGVQLFTLHAGAEVETEQESSGKVLIRLPDGRKGWVGTDAVGLVDPNRPFPVL